MFKVKWVADTIGFFYTTGIPGTAGGQLSHRRLVVGFNIPSNQRRSCYEMKQNRFCCGRGGHCNAQWDETVAPIVSIVRPIVRAYVM